VSAPAAAAGAGDGTVLDEEAFYGRLREFLAEQRPDLDGAIEPGTQLWDAGYLDSFGLIETISFLEELLGRPIEIGADDLPSFFTMEAMYAFVSG
jgi:acyl carrier protein